MEERGFFSRVTGVVPGLAVMIGTLWVIRTYLEPLMKQVTIFGQKGWLANSLGLNYILMGIIFGMVYRNVLFGGKIPAVLEEGFRMTRLFIKSGVIMLGSLYTIQSLLKMGVQAAILICAFVFGTVFLVFFLGRMFRMDRSLVGVMASACGVCGVSAAVATSPGVKAKPADVALCIATILGFGIFTMILSPYIGRALGMTDYQFGAWVGTGILNSGQVLATCLSFNPTIAPGTAVAYGEVWNVVRVITIPFVVFIITVWYWKGEASEEHISLVEIMKSKFPLFVLGFFAMTAASSLGYLGEEGTETLHNLRDIMQWIFGIGLIGQGAYIDFREIAKAGGKPLQVGLIAGSLKYILALLIALYVLPKTSPM